jgi:hypothetical protein
MRKTVTGTILGLDASTRTGTIRVEDGSRLTFSAAAVLGDFDALAGGDQVSFEFDRARPHHGPVTVLREPTQASSPGKKAQALQDLRYSGFSHEANVRSYRFDTAGRGDPVRRFVITVDFALMLKHHIGLQEAPALCLRKLTADLEDFPDSEQHHLDEDDLNAFASSRAAARERKKTKHSFRGQPGHNSARPVV